jgi:phospholipase/lecithinase/hemolysin/uncharacterized protein YhjY with autotransporter beta-barrel domain
MAHRFFSTLVLASCLTFPNYLKGDEFPKKLVVLGDSLSDAGNTPPSFTPALPGIALVFTPRTNGQTFPVYLAPQLGIKQITASNSGGTDFAETGAMTVNIEPVPSFVNPIISQVSQIGSNVSRKKSVVILQGGANDFFFGAAYGGITGPQSAQNYVSIIKALQAKKFKTIVAANLIDLATSPFVQSVGLSVPSHAFTVDFNTTLQQLLSKQKKNVLVVDAYSLLNDIIAHPKQYEFSSIGNPPLTSVPGHFLFWYDGIHPSQLAHQIIADYFAAILHAPVCVGTLAEVPFSVFRQQNTAIRQQLYPLQPLHAEQCIYPFVSGNYAPLLKHNTYSSGKEEMWGGNVTVGLTDRIAKHWTLGVAGSYAIDHDGCRCGPDYSFDLNTATLSLFGSYYPSRGYVNAIADVSWLDFDDIHRQFKLGPAHFRTKGDTDGHLYGGAVNGSYFVYKENDTLSTGPLALIEYQAVRVDGYHEKGARIGNLAYKRQRNQTLVAGLGWEVDWNITPTTITYGVNASLTANRQWLSNERDIKFREKSIEGIWGRWPYKNKRITYASGTVNFFTEFSNKVVLSLGYFANIGTFDMSEHNLTAGITFPIGGCRKERCKKETEKQQTKKPYMTKKNYQNK